MKDSLKDRFYDLFGKITDNETLIDEYWKELVTFYSNRKRIYHNLEHLENLFKELEPLRSEITDWEVVSLSVFYHDIIYNVRKQDNEEQSAALAVERLTTLGYDSEKIDRCKTQITATKSHEITTDEDANLFTDADLSILGKDWKTYETYLKAIRKEYKIYPNPLYKPARKKVLQHFLEMPRLFKTDYFKNLYEEQARKNISDELKSLS